jgi:hypothetical protein
MRDERNKVSHHWRFDTDSRWGYEKGKERVRQKSE